MQKRNIHLYDRCACNVKDMAGSINVTHGQKLLYLIKPNLRQNKS